MKKSIIVAIVTLAIIFLLNFHLVFTIKPFFTHPNATIDGCSIDPMHAFWQTVFTKIRES